MTERCPSDLAGVDIDVQPGGELLRLGGLQHASTVRQEADRVPGSLTCQTVESPVHGSPSPA